MGLGSGLGLWLGLGVGLGLGVLGVGSACSSAMPALCFCSAELAPRAPLPALRLDCAACASTSLSLSEASVRRVSAAWLGAGLGLR